MGDLGENAAEDVGAFLAAGAVVDEFAGDEFAGFDALLVFGGGELRCGPGGEEGVKEPVEGALEVGGDAAAERVEPIVTMPGDAKVNGVCPFGAKYGGGVDFDEPGRAGARGIR